LNVYRLAVLAGHAPLSQSLNITSKPPETWDFQCQFKNWLTAAELEITVASEYQVVDSKAKFEASDN
jgi:hypothetical protein